VVTALGLTEYVSDVFSFYEKVRRYGVAFINSYHPLFDDNTTTGQHRDGLTIYVFLSGWLLLNRRDLCQRT